MRRLDLATTAVLSALAIGFLAPARARSQDAKDGKTCANNLKQIGLAAIQYADDKRFFPHIGKAKDLDMGGDTTPRGNEVPPRCLRALIFFNYHDQPEAFVCSSSDDEPGKLGEKARKDIRDFGWLGSVPEERVSPLVKVADKDRDADALTDLSYGYTIKGYSSNSPATSLLAADRAARLGPRTKQKLAGNHKKGWTVLHVDAHTEFVKKGSDEAILYAAKDEKKKGYLVVWDELNAGDPVEEKKAEEKK